MYFDLVLATPCNAHVLLLTLLTLGGAQDPMEECGRSNSWLAVCMQGKRLMCAALT